MLNLSFSKNLIIKNLIKIIFVVICFLLIAYFGLGYSIGNIITNKKWLDPMFIIIGISFVLGLILGIAEIRFLNRIDTYLDKLITSLKNAIKGNLGEKKTFAKLKDILDKKDYKIYPNFHIPHPGEDFDLDAIIIGPKGIICLEIKNISGKFDFIGEDTYKYWYGNKLLLGEYNSPSREVIRHADRLQRWLYENNFKDISPKRFILLIDAEWGILDPSGYYVIKGVEKLADTIQKANIDPYFNEETNRQKITKFFGDKYLK